jgi:hypothetical protein
MTDWLIMLMNVINVDIHYIIHYTKTIYAYNKLLRLPSKFAIVIDRALIIVSSYTIRK